MQGRQGSNLRPTVLETATLPIELLPYLIQNQYYTKWKIKYFEKYLIFQVSGWRIQPILSPHQIEQFECLHS